MTITKTRRPQRHAWSDRERDEALERLAEVNASVSFDPATGAVTTWKGTTTTGYGTVAVERFEVAR